MNTSQHPPIAVNMLPMTLLHIAPLQVDAKQVCEAALYGPDELDQMNPEELARFLELLRNHWSASYSE